MHERIIIIDFGGQYAHLIASRIRRQGVLALIFDPEDKKLLEEAQNLKTLGVILSGGPQSVFEKDSPTCDKRIFKIGKPILGICYGHQFLAHNLGGKVVPGDKGEFGAATFRHNSTSPLFKDVPEKSVVWMNHVDEVGKLPESFQICGNTENCEIASFWNNEEKIFSVQFHLEVTHTQYGEKILGNFLTICGATRDWTIEKFLEEQEEKLKKLVGKKNVILFVSGGVDSTVAFAFLTKVLGKERVNGLFVDIGLMREGEVEWVEKSLEAIGANLTVLREESRFLKNLEGVYDPEEKREIVGHTFLDVQQDFFTKHDLHKNWILAQGTIYPDTIETGGTKHSSKIKTHHNRAPKVQELIEQGKVIEPLVELYKDEARELGELLGLPHELVWRHPFPGPGLSVRILCSEEDISAPINSQGEFFVLPIKSVGVQGDFRTYKHPAVLQNVEKNLSKLEQKATELINEHKNINRCVYLLGKNSPEDISHVRIHKASITQARVEILQKADAIVTGLLRETETYEKIWQFPVVLLPLSCNDIGEESVVLRPIDSIDAMSARVGTLPFELLEKMASEILKDSKISAVFLDVTSKPPGTIEWE